MQVTQKGFDLVSSCPDIWSALCVQLLADSNMGDFSAEDAVSVLAARLGVDPGQAAEMVRNLASKGYLGQEGQARPAQASPAPGVRGRSPVMTEEGVPSVLPTHSQTSAAESSGSLPSVLPTKPQGGNVPIAAAEKQFQEGAKTKFQGMLLPKVGQ